MGFTQGLGMIGVGDENLRITGMELKDFQGWVNLSRPLVVQPSTTIFLL